MTVNHFVEEDSSWKSEENIENFQMAAAASVLAASKAEVNENFIKACRFQLCDSFADQLCDASFQFYMQLLIDSWNSN